MSDTNRHKIEGKFNNKVIDLDDVPLNIRKKWDRENFNIVKEKTLKIKKRNSNSHL